MRREHRRPRPPGTKLEAQVDLLVRAFQESDPPTAIGVVYTDDEYRRLDYLYEEGVILVRDPDVERVRRALHGGGPREAREGERRLAGLTVFSVEGSRHGEVPDALRYLDRVLGVGVATPNHVLSVTQELPGPVTICPATEPQFSRIVEPDPGICPGQDRGRGVLVSVPDTGLLAEASTAHTWLAGVEGEDDPLDGDRIPPYTGHGTFVAGLVRCMARASEVVVGRVFARAGAGLEDKIVMQLDDALAQGCDVISLSAGGTSRSDLPLLGFEGFWERLRQHQGVVLVAAAGNNGDRRWFWPAAFPDVVSVGALAANWRKRADFSNYGGWVNVYAPGADLVNAFASGLYEYQEPPHDGEQRRFEGMASWSGTSFSTPLVAGMIAARMSRMGENGRQAAEALLARARAQAIPGVGPVLLPCDDGDGDCRDRPPACCSHRHHCGRC